MEGSGDTPKRTGISRDLAGRHTEIEALDAALQAPGSIAVIVGAAGVGKTYAARHIAAQSTLNSERVLWVAPTPTTRHIPFAAFAPIVAIPEGDPTHQLSELTHRFRHNPVDLIIIDDVDQLDSYSESLAAALATQQTAKLLATLRDPKPLPSFLEGRFTDGSATLIQFAAFDEPATSEVATELAGVELAASFHQYLWQTSQGNALFLREIFTACADQGCLRKAPGGVELVSTPSIPTSATATLSARISNLNSAERSTLICIATDEPLPIAAVGTDLEALAGLERAGLVTAADDLVRLHHPLVGDAITHSTGELERRAAAQRIATWRAQHTDTTNGLLRYARVCLKAHTSMPIQLADHAAIAALEAGDRPLAEQVLALHDPEAPSTLRFRAQAEIALLRGDHTASETLYRSAVDNATDDEVIFMMLARARIMTHSVGRPDRAQPIVASLLDLVSDPKARLRVEIALAELHAMNGRLDEGHRYAKTVLETPAASPEVHMQAAALAAFCQSCAGPHKDLNGLLTVADNHISQHGADGSIYRLMHVAAEFTHAAVWQTLSDAIATSKRRLDHLRQAETAPEIEAATLHCESLGHALSGNVNAADQAIRQASQTGHGNRFEVEAILHSMAAFTDITAGRFTRVEQRIDAFNQQRASRDSHFRPLLDYAAGLLHAHKGDPAQAARHMSERAAAAMNFDRNRVFAAFSLANATRIGHPELVARDLEIMTSNLDGAVVETLTTLTRGCVERDTAVVLDAAHELARRGFALHAAEAYHFAASFNTDPNSTARILLHRDHALLRCRDAKSPVPGLKDSPVLTERERTVIAATVTQGLSSRDTAALLFLSHRTIENHLNRVCRRLGASGRSELAELIPLDLRTSADGRTP